MFSSKLRCLAAATLTLALVGCSNSSADPKPSSAFPDWPPTQAAASSPSPSATPTQPAATESSAALGTGSKAPEPKAPEPKAPVAGAYPGAGGPIPSNASEITTLYKSEYGPDTAILQSPSGNIGCEIVGEFTGCGVDSWMEDGLYPDEMWGDLWFVYFDLGKVPAVGHRGDAPLYKFGDPVPQVLHYGQVAYYGSFVCASEQAGMTCWDSKTGHGALMNKAGYKAF